MKIDIKREIKGKINVWGWDNPSKFRTLTKEWLWTAQQAEKKKMLWFFVGLEGVGENKISPRETQKR